MLLLSITGLTRGYSAEPLFEDIDFELYHGERVGFVGPNGAGKTTLLNIMAGHDTPDAGDVRLHAGAELGLLEQVANFPEGRTLFDEARSAFDHLLAAQEEMIRVAEQMAATTDENQRKTLSERYDRLTELLSREEAFTLDHKVEEVLGGLGFKEADYARDLRSFSGGQQRRALLAKLLLFSPDVMLLDEPTNHLDISMVRWLEDYLVRLPQAMILVSHDRYFLNKVTNRTFELHQKRITSYPGNFQTYVRLREERYERELKEWEAQREYIDKQEEYIRRVHYGQLAKQAQSRRKQLDKIERLEKPTRVSGPRMYFPDVTRSGDIVFEAENLGKAFGDHLLFRDLSFTLERGKCLGIVGPNGCGKTTLLKILLGEEPPTEGKVHQGHLVMPGYLDQHLKILDDEKPLIRAVWPEPDPDLTEKTMRDMLGRFGLSGEIVDRPVRLLSGGERSRAALTRLVVEESNLLILDEPTNHLDIWACESLENALRDFEGTSIVVTHDRYFLNQVADVMIVFEEDKTQVVYGNYDTYELLRAAQQAAETEKSTRKTATKSSGKSPPTPTRSDRKPKRKFPYRKVEDLENDIARCEIDIARYEEELASPEIYREADRLKVTMQAFEDAKIRLQKLYEHWEEAIELN